jgi:membrane protease YdiL (CAAX protease family)
MRNLVAGLSHRAEFLIIVLGAFGLFWLSQLSNALSLLGGESTSNLTGAPDAQATISNAHLLSLLIYEPLVFALLWKFLSARGWVVERLGLRFTLHDIPAAVFLTVGSYFGFVLMMLALANLWTEGMAAHLNTDLATPGLTWINVLAVSLINPIFEEVFVCAYVVGALKERRGLSVAVNVSVLIRLSYHLYQGVIGVLGILPLGLVFTWWYARTGRLWPLIIAHGLFDLFGLLPYVTA